MMHRPWIMLLLVAAPATALAQGSLPRTHMPQPTAAAITAADLMTRLYILADDSMEGREAGTAGNVKGTDYIAAELKRMGLVPAGDNGTYFQTIPLKTRTFDTTSTIVAGGVTLSPFVDFLPLVGGGLDQSGLPVVYGGALGDSAHQITPEQASGKLVVFTAPARASGLRALRATPSLHGAAGRAVVPADSMPTRLQGQNARRPQAFLDDPTGGPEQIPLLLITSAGAARLFATPLAELTPGTPGAAADVHVRFTAQTVPYPTRNVVGIVPGSDARLRGEYVAIGAHNDHVGMARLTVDHDSLRIWNHVVRPEGADDVARQATPAQQAEVNSLLSGFRAAHTDPVRPDSISNGADDDGSGSVAVLEIAERIVTLRPKPKRSILFVWHTAEEKGLLGSRYFTDHATVPRDRIVAQLNLDMVGRGSAADETGRTKEGTPLHGSPGYVSLVGSRRLSTELGDLVEKVNRANHHLTFDYAFDADGHPSNIYCRSDHYQYARYGIPVTFFTTGLHSDYHQVTDEPQYIDYQHMAKVATLVEDIAVHVADLDHRIVVDHPTPDPAAPCRQ